MFIVIGAVFAIGATTYSMGTSAKPGAGYFPLIPSVLMAILGAIGDWTAFVTRPLSAGLLAAAALMIVIVLLPSISKKREATFHEEL